MVEREWNKDGTRYFNFLNHTFKFIQHSFDIFKDAGYSHFRLGSPDKSLVLDNAEEAFPDGGGPVAYVHFQNSYLELVQIGVEI